MNDVVIVSAARTPIGAFNGSLKSFTAPQLGAIAIKEAITRAGITPGDVSEVIMGNVLTAGVGQAPARQAALFAGLPNSVPCMTINKVCGSGLKSVMLGAQAIMAGDADVVVAGGQESMTNAPYMLDRARSGYNFGHGQLLDSMIKDGLWDVYNDYHMGSAAELCARECAIPRDAQDAYAIESYRRAIASADAGIFDEEMVPVPIPQRKGDPVFFKEDEDIRKVNFDKVGSLKPAFQKDGTVTAANASSLNDGAAAVVLMSASKAASLGLTPLATIVAQASAAKAPEWFTTAPADAIAKVLAKAGLNKDDIDLFEINEAFSVVSLAVNQVAGLDPSKVNIYGGAVAMGHPIGASGTRVLVTLLYALRRENKRRGLATLCIGGGEASALIVERV
ncbi:MAG: acetyl-CoA C-acetyltransferase [Ignavibacteriae bacterium]|nr:acetyl-CoA C-acetyltransferase [Ignavibacteriota bacterium]